MTSVGVRQTSLEYAEFEMACLDVRNLERAIDSTLVELNPDTKAIVEANLAIERALTAQANLQMLEDGAILAKKRKYNVTGITKLRWLIDADSPTFNKVDASTAELYRRRLLQHYHPDRVTGNIEMFTLVQTAVASASMELLAMLVMGIDDDLVTSEDLARYAGIAQQKLAKLKASNSMSVVKLARSGNFDKARTKLQALIDTKASLMQITMLNSYAQTNEEEQE